MSTVPFGRLLTAMATPFTPDGAVDYARAQQLARALIASGTEGLLVTGTTGESPTLSNDEKIRLWEATKEAVGSDAPIIAGSGNYNTAESIELSREAARVGADAILATVPYYNKPPQSGLAAHFTAIAMAVDLPVIVYNIPGRTSVNMTAETSIKLSRVPNIVGVKEASGNLDQIGQIIRDTDDDFFVWSGDDAITLPIMALGGYGVVSVASHLVGRQIARMIDCAVEGVPGEAAEIHHRLVPLFAALFPPTSTSPIPLKYALKKVGFDCGPLRLPLDEIDATSAKLVDHVLANQQIDLPAPSAI